MIFSYQTHCKPANYISEGNFICCNQLSARHYKTPQPLHGKMYASFGWLLQSSLQQGISPVSFFPIDTTWHSTEELLNLCLPSVYLEIHTQQHNKVLGLHSQSLSRTALQKHLVVV